MRKLSLAVFLLAAACPLHNGPDELTVARSQLQKAQCGAEPSIAGLASVHPGDPHAAFLGDWVIVSICHLDTLVKEAEKQQKPLSLFVEGRDTSNPPAGIDFQTGQVTFVLGRNNENKNLWHLLLYDPLFEPTIVLPVSAGVQGGHPLPRAPGANATVTLRKLYIEWMTWVWLAVLAVIVVALVGYARNSDLLREGPAVAGVKQPFSVARVQMAWWFFLILIGYVYIWMVTSDRDTITPSLLWLMGISAVTAVAGVSITPRQGRMTARRKVIDDEVDAVDKGIEQIVIDADDAARRGNAELQAVLAKKRAEAEARRAVLVAERAGLAVVSTGRGFWRDLVTDERGAVALDRFQIVAWTAILGVVFLQDVVWELSMPEFSATTLALMGISSGTYIGFKLPGKSS